jgi:protein SCO1/2
VTGTQQQLESLCANLGIAFVKVPGATAEDYTMDHSAALVLLDPQGRIAGYFPPPHQLGTLATDLKGVVDA